MIKIDGNYLEGGGQIIRTALSLSAVTGETFEIDNVRAGRSNPGLREQHLQAVNSVALLCDAKHNAKFGSTKFRFQPAKILSDKNEFLIKIKTAGSTALVISTVMPLAVKLKKQINVDIDGGGTWNIFAPPVIYLQKVLLPLLSKIGFKAEINIVRDGFYPKGGAKVSLKLFPWKPNGKLNLTNCNLKKNEVFSVASENLKEKNVAERQAKEALTLLKDAKINIEYADSICAGSGILIVKTPALLAGDSVGKRNITSKQVARDAVEKLQKELKAKACVDHRVADQLMIYMALSDGGKLKTSRISNHARTNAYVIEKFLPVKFKFTDDTISLNQHYNELLVLAQLDLQSSDPKGLFCMYC